MIEQDQQTDFSKVVEILEDVFGDYKSHNDYRGQISFDCPVCSHDIKGLDQGDGKGNLEVNYKMGVFKCWSCAESHETYGSLYKLIKKYGSLKDLKDYVLYKPDGWEKTKREYVRVTLPKEFVPFKSASQGLKMTHHYKYAHSYLKRRNISDEIINKYNIGFCYSGPYEHRIIIPSYNRNGQLNYFTGRSYLSNPRIKYKNPEADKEMLIWNEHLVRWHENIYLVEGVFDSFFLPNSIPILGKYVSDYLFDRLYDNALKITIVLDGDAWTDAKKLFHRLNCGRLMRKVWVIRLPEDKDIADLHGDLSQFETKQLD